MKLWTQQRWCILLSTLLILAAPLSAVDDSKLILISLDGIRLEEMIRGIDRDTLTYHHMSVSKVDELLVKYGADNDKARRERLMPFFWKEWVPQGQFFGVGEGRTFRVMNPTKISYPGYHEMLCGWVEPKIWENIRRDNPNETVLEWLQHNRCFRGLIAAFTSWDHFDYILNWERADFLVNVGWEACREEPLTERQKTINAFIEDGGLDRTWDYRDDVLTFHLGLDYLKMHKPRVLYLALGDGDEWGHREEYIAYVKTLALYDRLFKELWQAINEMDEYRGKTTVIVTTDHGRGDTPATWPDHDFIEAAGDAWCFVISPKIESKGMNVTARDGGYQQGQVAATVAELLGCKDFVKTHPKAAPALQF